MINFTELCDLLTERYKIDYILIDQTYTVQSVSQGVHRFFDEEKPPQTNQDIRESMYELIGYEEVIEKIFALKQDSFYLSTVNKNGYYVDVFLRLMHSSKHLAIVMNDVTHNAQKEQNIMQDRHAKDLLVKELAHKNYLLNKYQKASQEAMPMLFMDESCQISTINTNFLTLLGYSQSHLKHKHFNDIVESNDLFDKSAILQDMYHQKVHHTTLKLVTKHNKLLYVNAVFVPMFDEKDKMLKEILLIVHDITSHKSDNCQLQEIAYYDQLTGVLNRVGFDDKIDRLIQSQQPFSLMFLDLDFFKRVNDTYGHYYGDQILLQVSKRLGLLIDKNSFIARYGGDEFILLIHHSTQATTAQLAQNIVESISKAYPIEDKIIHIGVSIGIAHFPQDTHTKEELIEQADKAMYCSKNKGRNQFSFYGE